MVRKTQARGEKDYGNLKAASAYLKQLREALKDRYGGDFTQTGVSQEVTRKGFSVSQGHLLKIEGGEHSPDFALLSRLIRVLGGNLEEYESLLMNEKATERDGMRIAIARLDKNEEDEQVDRLVNELGGEAGILHWFDDADIRKINQGMKRFPHLIRQFAALVSSEEERHDTYLDQDGAP